jgi:hypothetical protein
LFCLENTVSIGVMFEVIGAIGASLLLFSFYRTSIGKWSGKSIWFELDNLVAAACMITYAISKDAYISIVLNIIWAFVAIRGLSSIAERRRKKK